MSIRRYEYQLADIENSEELISDDIEYEEFFYNENDVESTHISNTESEEAYLMYNCRFYFYTYGGQRTLPLDDYYILNNIYDNIYCNLHIMETFNNEDFELNNDNYIQSYKIKNYILNIFTNYNEDKYNLINNTFYVYLLKNKKLVKLYNKFNNNDKY